MANIGSWLGNVAHDALISGAAKSAASHMATGAIVGGAYGIGSSFANDTGTPISDGVGKAVTGAILGGATRFASARYATGKFSSALAGRVAGGAGTVGTAGASATKDNPFKFSYFTGATSHPTSFLNVDAQVVGNLSSRSFNSV